MTFRTFGAPRAMFPDAISHVLRLPRVCYAPDDGNGGAPPVAQPPAAKPSAVDPDEPAGETFSRDYVKELRAENKGWRLKASEQEQARKQAEEAAAKAQQEADAKITAAEKAANDRIIRAELKALAIAAGMVDLDGLKLADLSKVTIKEDGSVEGGEALITELKTAKPYLFGPTHSANPNNPPPSAPPAAKKATEMTDEEYRAAKKAVGLKA